MDDDPNNINLMPDDLRGEEEKYKSVQGGEIPIKFHLPQKPSQAAAPFQPKVTPEAKETPQLKEEIKPTKEAVSAPVLKKIKKVKLKSKARFFAKLLNSFKKKKAVPVKEEALKIPKIKSEPVSKPPFQSQEYAHSLVERSPAPLKGQLVEEEPVPEGMGVNLIPAGIYLTPNRKIYISFGLAALTGIIIVGLAYAGLFFYGKYLEGQNKKIDLELEQGEEIFGQYKAMEEEAMLLSKKIESAKSILERHVYWTKVFAALEQLTTEDVYYASVAASLNGAITLSAVAPNYTAVARQYIVFQKATDVVDEVQIAGASGDVLDSEVTFNILLKLKPEIYYSLTED